jgi:hypothetical protein
VQAEDDVVALTRFRDVEVEAAGANGSVTDALDRREL